MTIADRLAVLDQGVIQQVGTPRELYDTPANRFVAEFVGSINVCAGRVLPCADGTSGTCAIDIDGLGRVRVPVGRIAAPAAAATIATDAGGAVAVAFRPHAVRLAGGSADDGLAFDADIGSTEFLGEFVRHELVVGSLRIVADLPHARFVEALAPGARARFAVAAAEIVILAEPR